MQLKSLGYRTDIALLELGGSQTEDRVDHLVVRSPHNPTHWWGNFLLVAGLPDPDQCAWWLDRFTAEFPGAEHVALGFDATAGSVVDLEWYATRGLTPEAATVLTATATDVHPPRTRNGEVQYRQLASDDDWAQSVDLRVRCHDGRLAPAVFRTYATTRAATNRRMTDAGHGAWFGGFAGERLLTQMGLFAAGPRLARFQSVETDPDHRRCGLAGSLIHHVTRYGFEQLAAQTLVIVADPDYYAIDLYRSVGFVATETQLQVERAPDTN